MDRKHAMCHNLDEGCAGYAAIDGEGVDYDVTAFLQQIMAGDSLVFEIENHNFVVNGHNFVPKDPKFGIVKRLQVTYSYGNGPADRIERPEHSRLVLPEDSQLKILAAGFAAIQQQKPLFSPLQIQVLQLRAGLIQFLKEIGSLPRLGADSTTQGTVDYMVQYAEHKRDVEGPWLAGLRSHYVLKFKAEAEKIYHLLSVNGLVDPQLRHLASEADSPETIQALADALWEVGGRISV